jgi:mRNA interferase RelE/StbE
MQIVHAAQKQLLSLPRQAQIAAAQAIDSLARAPRPSHCKKLRGTELWRVRLERYRIIYAIDDKVGQVTILKIAARREDTYHSL